MLEVGDSVLVHGGYDGEASTWLAGGEGARGTIVAIDGKTATIELDSAISLSGGQWQDFGGGSAHALGTVDVASGQWLVVMLTWVGAQWVNPTEPVHVAICSTEPVLSAIPEGGGIGVWVESHATVTRIVEAAPPLGTPMGSSDPSPPTRWWKRFGPKR